MLWGLGFKGLDFKGFGKFGCCGAWDLRAWTLRVLGSLGVVGLGI